MVWVDDIMFHLELKLEDSILSKIIHKKAKVIYLLSCVETEKDYLNMGQCLLEPGKI